MKKKILIFSTFYLPFVGGAEVSVREITDRLSEYEFHLITLRIDKRLARKEKIGNVVVHRIGFAGGSRQERPNIRFPLSLNKYIYPFIAYWKARELHKKHTFDITWAIMAAYAGLAAQFFAGKYPAVPYVLTLQEGTSLRDIQKKGSSLGVWFKRVFSRARLVHAISNYLATFAADMGYTGPIVVVPNGVDIKRFGISCDAYKHEQTVIDIFKRGGATDSSEVLTGHIKFVITVSRLAEKNGVDDLIRSIKYLPDDVKLLILGEGELLEQLRELVIELKLEKRVYFLGFVSHEDLPRFLCVSSVFVRASHTEGFGNAFIEAMAANVPVIATPVGGIVDFLYDPESNPDKEPTGLFCEVNNPNSIADRIHFLFEQPELKNRMVKNAASMVRARYDWDIVARQMKEEVFEKVLQ